MSIPDSTYQVYIYKNDFNAMCTEVYKHQDIETGGNLFGLWTTSGSVVIHVVLGPGQHCRRTNTSFHQDLEYMGRVGRFVNDSYMLCHIGEWHSHHNLSLSKPSAGDESTIRHNFPQGMSKFLVVIANIRNGDTIKLSPYFFTHGGTRYEKAEYVVLEPDSPFSTDVKILAEIELGAEGKEYQQNETNRGGASLTGTSIPRNTGSNSQQNDNARPTYLQVASRGSYDNPRNTGSNTRRGDSTSTTTQSQALSTNSSAQNADKIAHIDTSDAESPPDRPNPPVSRTSSQATNNFSEGDQTATSEGDDTTKEVILNEIKDQLQKYFGDERKVDIESTRYGDVQMTFKHGIKYWMLRFPKTFPSQPAQLFLSYHPEHSSTASPCSDYFLEKPLTNHANILLSIKKNCRGQSCNICRNITKENLTKSDAPVIPISTKLADFVTELTNEITVTLSTPLKFAGEAQNDGSYRMEFEHFYTKWSVELPAEFPNKPAEVYKHERRYGVTQEKKIETCRSSNTSNQPKPLVSSDLIMLAIRSNCSCQPCWNS